MSPHHTMAEAATHAMDPLQIWIALTIFIVTYAIILTERVNRAVVALLGGGAMILTGIMSQHEAIAAVDFNTLGLLLGMMVIVGIAKDTGMFEYTAIKAAQVVKASPTGLLVATAVLTAVFSALLDNVTTVLLMTPVLLLLTRQLKLPPFPYLFTSILMSNIGGSATLVGDPPNIMIGSAANLGFNAFVYHLAPLALVVAFATMGPLLLMYRKQLIATDYLKERIMKNNANDALTNKPLLLKSLFVMFLVLLGFVVGHPMGIEPASVALGGAALLMLLDNITRSGHDQEHHVHKSLADAEWVTLFFFMGLFVLVYGLEHVGLINWMAERLLDLTEGNLMNTTFALLWGSAVLSALVDNIPFVATMIPLLQEMIPQMGEGADVLWWALAAGACLGGNGSLVGASANLVVAGMAAKAGHPIGFAKFMFMAFPLMILSIIIATGYMALRYF